MIRYPINCIQSEKWQKKLIECQTEKFYFSIIQYDLISKGDNSN